MRYFFNLEHIRLVDPLGYWLCVYWIHLDDNYRSSGSAWLLPARLVDSPGYYPRAFRIHLVTTNELSGPISLAVP